MHLVRVITSILAISRSRIAAGVAGSRSQPSQFRTTSVAAFYSSRKDFA
jgi:hypothetical protein